MCSTANLGCCGLSSEKIGTVITNAVLCAVVVEAIMNVPQALETAKVWTGGERSQARKRLNQEKMVVNEKHRRDLIIEISIEIWGCQHNGYKKEDKRELENLLLVIQNAESGREL